MSASGEGVDAMPRWAIVLLVGTGAVVVLAPIGLLVGYVHVYGANHENMRFPSDDVTVARCGVEPASRRPVAELTITSQAARKGGYAVLLDFQVGEGGLVTTGRAVVEGLAPGETGRATVVGERSVDGRSADGGSAEGLTCVVADARFEAAAEPKASVSP